MNHHKSLSALISKIKCSHKNEFIQLYKSKIMVNKWEKKWSFHDQITRSNCFFEHFTYSSKNNPLKKKQLSSSIVSCKTFNSVFFVPYRFKKTDKYIHLAYVALCLIYKLFSYLLAFIIYNQFYLWLVFINEIFSFDHFLNFL